MAKKPEQRFRSCAELVAALTPFCQEVRAADLDALRSGQIVASLPDGPAANAPPPQVRQVELPSSLLSGAGASNQWPSLASATGLMTAPPPARRKPMRVILGAVALGALLSIGALVFLGLQDRSPSAPGDSTSLAAQHNSPTKVSTKTGQGTQAGQTGVARPAKPDKYAFLLGVSNYPSKELQPHPFAESDMGQLAKLFLARDYRASNIVLMTAESGSEDARWLPQGNNVRAELSKLLRRAAER